MEKLLPMFRNLFLEALNIVCEIYLLGNKNTDKYLSRVAYWQPLELP